MVPGDKYDYFGISGQSTADLRAKGYVVWLPPRPKGEFLGEGDTFTFFNLIGNGLSAYRDETPGGWGGRGETDWHYRCGRSSRISAACRAASGGRRR